MTKAEKRIQIASDVIKQVKLGMLKPKFGTFIERKNPVKIINRWGHSIKSKDFTNHDAEPTQLCNILERIKCEVCALGAIFAETVKRYNDFESAPHVIMDDGEDYLEKWFSKEKK